MINTKGFIESLTTRCSQIATTYYELAPTTTTYPYAVVNGLNIIDNADFASGDLISFYIDIYTDNKAAQAAEQLEKLCQTFRNELFDTIISTPGIKGHISFDSQQMPYENEFDLTHRRLSLTSRIFYYT